MLENCAAASLLNFIIKYVEIYLTNRSNSYIVFATNKSIGEK